MIDQRHDLVEAAAVEFCSTLRSLLPMVLAKVHVIPGGL
jgi:hypothetical protein